MIASMNHLDKK